MGYNCLGILQTSLIAVCQVTVIVFALLHVMVCIFDECCLLSAVMLSTAVRAIVRV